MAIVPLAGAPAAALPATPAAAPAAPSPNAAAHDLAVGVTGTVTGRAGQSVPVAVSWRNTGPAVGTGVVVSYLPPLGAEVAAGGLPPGWTRVGRSAVRSLGRLAVGASGSATVTVTIGATARPGLLVGGAAEILAVGLELRPGNNQSASRIRVQAGASPSPTPSRTPSPTRSPTPSPTRTPTTRPTASPSRTASATGATAARTTTTSAAVREPALAPSTYVVPARAASPRPDVVEVIDAPAQTASWLLPGVGAVACFTAAGLAGMTVRRRRAAERAHHDEVRHLQQVS